MPSTQTPEYTVRLRTPHEHQREKETPEPLASAGASGKGRMPMWKSPAVDCYFVVQAPMAHRRAPSTVAAGDEMPMNFPHLPLEASLKAPELAGYQGQQAGGLTLCE